MKDVSIHQIREAFGEVTYNRGWGYFENVHVDMVVKKGNKLIGTVFGRAPAPYEVQVEVTDKINSRCSCPVGAMCKHGVAVILQWINKKESFADADQFMASLHKKNKDELLNIIGLVMEEDPFLISRLMLFQHITKDKIDLEAISRRIDHSGYGYTDYYAVSGMVNELERIKRTADTLKLEGNLKDAVQVYLLLIEKGAGLFQLNPTINFVVIT